MKKSLKVGDIVLRRDKGQAAGSIVGRAVVLSLVVKSDLPIQTKEYQKVRFSFEGSDPSNKENRSVGDLFFSDKVGRTTDKRVVQYVKHQRVADIERAKREKIALKEKYGKIPANVIEKIHGHFGCQEKEVCELVKSIYA